MSTENYLEEELIECDENDFMDALSEQALKAEAAQKKDEKSKEGKRNNFDSADYWMKIQKEKEQTTTNK